jgi:hypothetical protein
MKKNYFLTILCLLFYFTIQAQSGNGHDPSLVLSYTPSGYTAAPTMRQDNGYTSFSKNTINNNGGGTDLFFNFTFDTSGKSMYVAYTTDGTDPNTGSTNVTGAFSNYADPNRTWLVTIPAQASGTTIKYIFYASDGAIGSSWGRISATGYTTTLGDAYTPFSYTVYESNVAAGGNWDTGATWNSGSIPNSATMPVEVIGTNAVTLNQNADVLELNLLSGSILNLSATHGITVNGSLINNGTINANSGSSIKISGTSTGNITYNLNVNDTNWHLLSSPVEGEGYDTSWVDANLIDNTTRTTGTNVGIATYINTSDADGDWTYATDGSSGNFDTGKGYSIKRDATGSDIAFTGTLKVNDASLAITANDIGGGSENRWTLIGNPFPSYINVTSLLGLAANGTALEDSREALYVFDNNKSGGAGYSPITTGYIHPGQAFFVNSNVASTNIAINQDMLSHQTGITFYKNTNPSINLILSDGNNTKNTEINYIADKTTGLDPRFDLGTFTGTSTSFNVYSHLVSNSNGVDFIRQALPIDYENQVIPIGVNAAFGKEITFTAQALNLPQDIKVFLEDRTANTFTRLDEANSEYTVTLNNAANGIGQFYLHTSKSSLSVKDVNLNNISVYTTDDSTLKIVGLYQGKSDVKLFNILGKQVFSTSFKSNGVQEISLPKLATGIYIVQVATENGKLNKKIVLE